MQTLTVTADQHIPYIKELLAPYCKLQLLPASDITNRSIKDSDALIIRTRTHCNATLLEGTKVQFIATATIGYDHIDTHYCQQKGIYWTTAPGSNANSVVQYVMAALSALAIRNNKRLSDWTLGIIGVGNVGSRLAQTASIIGMKTLLNDPPREKIEGSQGFTDIDTLLSESDIITIHTPLTTQGEFATYHLADRSFFERCTSHPIVINSARGEVVDTAAILEAAQRNIISDMVIDCWQSEPHISMELLNRATIATPHIAGYSLDGKLNATMSAVSQFAKYFDLEQPQYLPTLPQVTSRPIEVALNDRYYIERAILATYNPIIETDQLKSHPDHFEAIRNHYPLRREAQGYSLSAYNELLRALGFK